MEIIDTKPIFIQPKYAYEEKNDRHFQSVQLFPMYKIQENI